MKGKALKSVALMLAATGLVCIMPSEAQNPSVVKRIAMQSSKSSDSVTEQEAYEITKGVHFLLPTDQHGHHA